jgi:cell division protein FtsL
VDYFLNVVYDIQILKTKEFKMSTKIQQKEATVKIQTKQIKEATITAKLQLKQKEKIEKLAKKNGITISNLVLQLVEAGYKQFTKNDL